MTAPLVSVVLPVRNQADHIERVAGELAAALDPLPARHELVLVVNASRDDSLGACERFARSRERVRVLHSERPGWGRSVRLGLAATTGQIVAYTNAARTRPQDLQLAVLCALCNPGVVVKATRKIRESARRRFASLAYNLECRALFDLPYWDVNGTPKVFPRDCDGLLALTRDDDLIDLEFCIRCRRADARVLEVPIFSARRHGGRSTTSWRSALRMYWGAYALWRELRRAH
jgi:glycosyltransferase involved in cell wall biosynthesis